jgi:hypothetical protein
MGLTVVKTSQASIGLIASIVLRKRTMQSAPTGLNVMTKWNVLNGSTGQVTGGTDQACLNCECSVLSCPA